MIVGIIGLVVIGIGGYQAYKGMASKFLDDSHTERMGPYGARRSLRSGWSDMWHARLHSR